MADAQSIVTTQGWIEGANSLVDPIFLPDRQYQWMVNGVNRGGPCQTRPGFHMLSDNTRLGEPRGITWFKPIGQSPFLVKVIGHTIRVSQAPFTTWSSLSITLDDGIKPVYFEVGVKGAITEADGTLTRIDPYPILIIQTNVTKAAMWDGVTARFLETTEMPIGSWMKWVGNRMATIDGHKVHFSNLLDPINHSEEANLASGGYWTLPDEGTGLAATADVKSLLAFTSETTTSFAVTNPRFADPITGVGGWSATPGFQQVILPGIGCAAGRSIVNQYGYIWWYTMGGLIFLDDALRAFRTSAIHYSDSNMARSKGNLSDNISGIAGGSFENFLLMSVPSGHIYNMHTWAMDQSVVDNLNSQTAPAWAGNWTGLNPVQWVSLNVDGKPRCFCLSKDFDDEGFTSNVWEAFTPESRDVGTKRDLSIIGIPVPCSMESKFLSENTNQKKFGYIEYMLSELSGSVSFQSFYASRHSGYKQVMDKTLVATTDTTDDNTQIDNFLPAYLHQTRRLRTSGDTAQTTDGDSLLEDSYTRNRDKGFFVLTKWSGQAAIDSITLVCNYDTDPPRGVVQQNEVTKRHIDAGGESVITEDTPLPHTLVDLRSRVFSPISPRWQEETYNILE